MSRLPAAKVLALLFSLFAFLFTSVAVAQASVQAPKVTALHVLELDSDDADDQAEALTGALRSRVRATPNWQLLETTQSLSMMTAALRCPQRPDAPCLQRIADQLKAERFFWGLVNKDKSGQHQVTAEVHLYVRGKADQAVKESYSENLRDQNDEALHKMASRIFERLTGMPTSTLVIQAAADDNSPMFLDGEAKGQLDHGHASLQVAAGTHTVELRGPSGPLRQTVVVAQGATAEVRFVAATSYVEATPKGPSRPLPIRKIVAWSLVGAGIVAAVIGGIETAGYFKIKSDMDKYRATVPANQTVCDVPASEGCAYYQTHNGDAKTDSAVAVVSIGAGVAMIATGAYLALTDRSPGEGARPDDMTRSARRLRVLPSVGRRSGGVDVRLEF